MHRSGKLQESNCISRLFRASQRSGGSERGTTWLVATPPINNSMEPYIWHDPTNLQLSYAHSLPSHSHTSTLLIRTQPPLPPHTHTPSPHIHPLICTSTPSYTHPTPHTHTSTPLICTPSPSYTHTHPLICTHPPPHLTPSYTHTSSFLYSHTYRCGHFFLVCSPFCCLWWSLSSHT